MRRILVLSLFVVVAIWSIGRLRHALASPEERIRMRLEQMELGFDTTKVAGVLGGFAEDYRDEGSGIGRDEVQQILRHLVLRQFAGGSSSVELRVDLEDVVIELDPDDPERATSRMRAVFWQSEDEVEKLYWDARVTGDWRSGPDGWQLVRTRDVNHADRGRL